MVRCFFLTLFFNHIINLATLLCICAASRKIAVHKCLHPRGKKKNFELMLIGAMILLLIVLALYKFDWEVISSLDAL